MNDLISQIASQLGARLLRARLVVTTAESCTGGGIAEALTRVPGSSAWFECGFVTYSNTAKQKLLGVDAKVLAQNGAVSQQVVLAMAEGARLQSGANLAVAVSGIAGPGGGTPEKPVGSVWIAWSNEESNQARSFLFEGDRQAVRTQSVVAALEGLIVLS